MPYTEEQLRCLTGMGIVPWIERASALTIDETFADTTPADATPVDTAPANTASANTTSANNSPADDTHAIESVVASGGVAAEPEQSMGLPDDFMQTPLVEITFRGQQCTQLGKSDAPLLILVEAISHQQKQYPFEATDAKLFDDMLRAIAWRRQDVCLAVTPPTQQGSMLMGEGGPCVGDLCKPHRDAVLFFRHSLPNDLNADALRVPMERASMPAWQLPHPQLLRESPNRKRQAWNVLKAARARLQ